MKKMALAGLFLVLVGLGIAYSWVHRSGASSSNETAVLVDRGASGQVQAAAGAVNGILSSII
jgi:hypothetical protein